ncbi:hypothetical protein KC19_11G095000 [Ceratodon purpureus]|uniref:Uncharacterized protein n=1 Tax=Ceratodon purpureus TaxID=3225 RepID=A0A8T0GGU7_CERPU|nr:hypothetical protein KC19_11G095000 [Ceratodon purpureus]
MSDYSANNCCAVSDLKLSTRIALYTILHTMGGSTRSASKLVPFFRNAAASNRQSCVRDGVLVTNRLVSTVESSAGGCDESRAASGSVQGLDEERVLQQKPSRVLFSRTLQSNFLRNARRNVQNPSSESQRRRNVPVLREGLIQNVSSRLGGFGDRTRLRSWLGQRYFSADGHSSSESKKKGLSESQIGQELLSEISKESTSDAAQGLKLAHGEVLSPEEEAALKLAEAEFERVQREEPVSVENIQEMLKELQSVADPKDPRIAIVSLRLGQEYEARGEDPKTFLKLGEQALSIFTIAGEFSVEVGMCHHLIALAHHRLGQQELSLENLNKAQVVLKDKEGKESAPVKFAIQFLMGDTLAALGKHEDALQHYVEGLAVQETILEKGHPQLANNYRQVGEAFTQVMLFYGARYLVEKALEIHVKANGKNSIEEAIDRRLLSVIYSGLEEHEKALEEQLAVKSILNEKNLGSEARFVEIAIADTQVTLGRIDDAIATLQKVISNLEEGSSLRVLATVNLSKAFTQQGNEEKAGEYSRAAIALLDSKLEGLSGGQTGGETELLTVGECYTELASLHQRMKQPDEAIALLKKGLSVYKKLPQQLNAAAGSQAQIGMLLKYFTGKAREAIPYMEEAAANLRHSYGDGHFSLALVLNHLAVGHVQLENPAKAVELFEESKSILTKTPGPRQLVTLAVYYNLMKVYASMGRKDEAIANARHVVMGLEKYGKKYGLEKYSALAVAKKDLENLQNSQDVSSPECFQKFSEPMGLRVVSWYGWRRWMKYGFYLPIPQPGSEPYFKPSFPDHELYKVKRFLQTK